MRTSYRHLSEVPNNEETPFYTKFNPIIKLKIKPIFQEAQDNDIISKKESEAMNPDGTGVGQFYLGFKVHNAHIKISPERTIVIQCGSMTGNIGKFVDYHIKDVSTQHAYYLQDTQYFIRKIEEINERDRLPENSMIKTFDVRGLFTIIPQDERIRYTREALNKRNNPQVPTEFPIRLQEIVLTNSTFQFADQEKKAKCWNQHGY